MPQRRCVLVSKWETSLTPLVADPFGRPLWS